MSRKKPVPASRACVPGFDTGSYRLGERRLGVSVLEQATAEYARLRYLRESGALPSLVRASSRTADQSNRHERHHTSVPLRPPQPSAHLSVLLEAEAARSAW